MYRSVIGNNHGLAWWLGKDGLKIAAFQIMYDDSHFYSSLRSKMSLIPSLFKKAPEDATPGAVSFFNGVLILPPRELQFHLGKLHL